MSGYGFDERQSRTPSRGVPGVLSALRNLIAKSDSSALLSLATWRRAAREALNHLGPEADPEEADLTHALQALREHFPAADYLAANPDVAFSGVEPLAHFLEHGILEGRTWQASRTDFFQGSVPRHESKEDLLLLSHDATVSGGPLVALSLLTHLSSQYNVYVGMLRPGPLLGDFISNSVAVAVGITNVRATCIGELATPRHHHSRGRIRRVIANTLESTDILPQLLDGREHAVLSLVHEFPTERNVERIKNAFRQSDLVVFSSEFIRDRTVAVAGAHGARNTLVIPQGKLDYRRLRRDNPATEIPEPLPTIDVLGIGSREHRKGVDLFIEVASRVGSALPDRTVNFAWLGDERDGVYDDMLEQQAQLLPANVRLTFLAPVPDPDEIVRSATVFLLTSRMDPLPNVAIDAIWENRHLVCFADAGGIPDLISTLEQNRAYARGSVVPLLNVEAMASRTTEILQSVTESASEEKVSPPAAREMLSFDFYAKRIAKALEDAETRRAYALEAAGHRPWPTADDPTSDLQPWRGLELRKPEPGFHPGIFAEAHNYSVEPAEAFREYVAEGRPDGPWKAALLDLSPVSSPGAAAKSALHIHAYYPELVHDIARRLSRNSTPVDVFISAPSSDKAAAAAAAFEARSLPVADTKVVPNLGRDIGPFLFDFVDELADYELIGHVHTKRSELVGDAPTVDRWRSFLLENLLGGTFQTMDSVLSAMSADSGYLIAFPDDPLCVGWDANRHIAARLLAQRYGEPKLPDYFNFPVGTMFWARRELYEAIQELVPAKSLLPREPVPYDGTLLHALERILGLLPQLMGKESLLVRVPGANR
ncbi:MAG: glycosyltransferase [Actinomycetota bacterium]|nr:glycosyltransferase [Actinomycetota bacterium]